MFIASFIFLLSRVYSVLTLEVTWCTYGIPEFEKCSDIAHDFKSSNSQLQIKCEANEDDSCVELIAASITKYYTRTVDASFIYKATLDKHNIKVILAEAHGKDYQVHRAIDATYLAVAVVKSGTDLSLKYLKGKRTCHSGYFVSSGWGMPIGYLAYRDRINLKDGGRCDAVKKVSRYFKESCVPGAISAGSYNLCNLCSADSCATEEKYAGNDGAFRCLVETEADVAFVVHSTVTDNTDGANSESWAKSLKSTDFRLLCQDGDQATVDSYLSCNIGLMPTGGLVVNGNMSDSDVAILQRELRNPPPLVEKYLFNSKRFSSTDTDVMFSDATTELVYVVSYKQQPLQYLGVNYVRYFNSLNCIENSSNKVKLSLSVFLSVLLLLICGT